MGQSTASLKSVQLIQETVISIRRGGIIVGKKHFLHSRTPHRGAKHLSHRVNGETEQTLSNQITEIQARKRS
ncbi:YpzG family protein [Halobacillus fulvus]|nr:YpzG family protein [Halobacillus fulvus]